MTTAPWAFSRVRPHRWQQAALSTIVREVLHQGVKGVVSAATGSGKTVVQAELAALLIPTLAPHERIVVTAPSQPLVEQLFGVFSQRVPGRVGMYYEHEKRVDRPIILACHASLVSATTTCPCSPLSTPHLRWGIDARWRRFFAPCPAHGSETAVAVDGGLALALAAAGLRIKLWIADEAHKTSSKQVMAFAAATQPVRRVGFSATPFRASRDERLWLFEKEIVRYTPTDALRDGVIVSPDIRPYEGEGEERGLEEVILSMIQDAEGPGVINAWDTTDAEHFATWLTAKGFPAAALHSYLSSEEQASRLSLLRSGRLRALVHVNLLVEGRDIPWLRWLCLRRVSQSKGLPSLATTRLIQEVGRVLRRSPGKQSAVIYDPHGLFYVLSLTQEALLGGDWSVDDPLLVGEEEAAEEQEEEEKEGSAAPRERKSVLAPSDALATWAIRLRAAGTVPWTPRTPKRLSERCSEDTIREIAKCAKERKPAILSLPCDDRDLLLSAIAEIVRAKASQAKGDDALSVLMSLRAA